MKLQDETTNIHQLYEETVHAVQTEGKEWVTEVLEDDPIDKLTGGKMTVVCILFLLTLILPELKVFSLFLQYRA